MNNNLQIAKRLLAENDYTCVLYKNGREYNSRERGVKPLIDFLESGKDFKGFFAADKTIGAGAAHMYVLLGVNAVFANIISEEGKKILQQNKISVFYENLVPFIINRKGNGPCPIETAVKGIENPRKALETIKNTIRKLDGA